MSPPLVSLQRAVFERLSSALSCPVYDHVPMNAPLPYAHIGADEVAVDWNTKTERGWEISVSVHVWSAYSGMAELKNIVESVDNLLIFYPVIPGYSVHDVRHVMTEIIEDPDGYRHGIVRVRFKIEQEG